MKFTAIIPVYNGAEKITPTIATMLNQTSVQDGRDTVEIIVVDGASTDGTASVARDIGDDRITVISEPDTGMYDALAKGLVRADGEVTCYLPAGEVYDLTAFSVISGVLETFPHINWITGMSAARNRAGQIVRCRLPHPYRRDLFDCGAYGDQLWALQQESTFWRSTLNDGIDLERLAELKLAGDFFLWRSFAAQTELYVVQAFISAFTFEDDQLSRRQPGAYLAELRSIARKPTLRERLTIWRLRRPQRRVIPRLSAARSVFWDLSLESWRIESE